MATLKYIIKNQTKKNGKNAIYLRITHNRKNTSIKTGIDVFKEEWVSETERLKKIKKGTPNIARLNNKLDKLKVKAFEVIDKLNENEKLNNLSVLELKNLIINRDKKVELFSFWQNFIDNNVFNSINTKKAHQAGLNSFRKFNSSNLRFEEVTVSFLEDYENWNLKKGNKYNGFATNINMLKLIFNKAIDRNLVSRDKYPFSRFKVKTNEPEKKAISPIELNLLKNTELTDSKLIYARDLFFISYYIGGIAFIDLCKLKYKNLKDGFILFKRTKTKVKVVNKVSEKLKLLLNKYLNENASDEDYIFDLIKNDDFTKNNLEYNRSYQNYHNALKKLGKLCGLKEELKTYVPRHTYATNSLNVHNMPITYVKNTLGHKNIRTTQKYVDTFNKSEMGKYANML